MLMTMNNNNDDDNVVESRHCRLAQCHAKFHEIIVFVTFHSDSYIIFLTNNSLAINLLLKTWQIVYFSAICRISIQCCELLEKSMAIFVLFRINYNIC